MVVADESPSVGVEEAGGAVKKQKEEALLRLNLLKKLQITTECQELGTPGRLCGPCIHLFIYFFC